MKTAAAACACLLIIAAGCGNASENKTSSHSESVSSNAEKAKPEAGSLRREIIGSFGRLGEVMHEFYDDGMCVIGGMAGDYEIDDNCTLILTTVNGTRTEYVWGDITADNYWRFEDGVITVNGNEFSKIDVQTGDTAN